MTVNQIIEENRELQLQLSKAINTITKLENRIAALQKKIEALQKENEKLKDENKKLQKQNNILMRAIEIALQIHNAEAQYKHLSLVLQKIKETGEFKG
ncbi:cell division protein ZapB [Sulfuracidifex tepidarius]|uniref:Uncharacterized protein n=1 Tax=Sulfuracidifex tepidarius TaxID=1294262 RepID=A0A510E304_9CREN|nr:cell division protein ZapB [Sulfuracidifex tepidarius]BBG24128.1 hypothetical protein IC006_1430 [Sulfuracidifex tepidarius]BBG26884.1 hypothetical protein IC007_1406 [Sulfuracidifex tepidarius]